jgi:hypothetical protein
MNPSARPEVPRETDQVREHRGDPRVDAVPQEFSPNEQAAPRNPFEPHVSNEGAFENFVGGAGI